MLIQLQLHCCSNNSDALRKYREMDSSDAGCLISVGGKVDRLISQQKSMGGSMIETFQG